jgi:RNA polymerase sigma-70 factor (ECF subfamily)
MTSPPDDRSQPFRSNDAFGRLYEASFATVWSYAVSRVGREMAEDLVSETFAIAWRRRDALPSDPLPWLVRVARNLVLETYRAAARQRSLETALKESPMLRDRTEADVADAVVTRHQALTALATLSDKDRELLMLIAWHGLSPRQAAKALGCSRPTFFVRLHRARRRLEHAMGSPAPSIGPPRPLHTRIHHKEA